MLPPRRSRGQPVAGRLPVAAHDDVAARVGEVDLRHPQGEGVGHPGTREREHDEREEVGTRESGEVENGHRGSSRWGARPRRAVAEFYPAAPAKHGRSGKART